MAKKEKVFWKEPKEGKKAFKILESNKFDTMICFDVETSGLSAVDDRVIQFAAIKYSLPDLNVLDKINLYIKHDFLLSRKITEITGITDEFLNSNGEPEATQFPKIQQFFGENPLVIGYNVEFDIRFIQDMYTRFTGRTLPLSYIDVLVMSRELYQKGGPLPNHKLSTMAEYLGVADGLQFHDAFADVTATTRLLRVYLDDYQDKFKKLNSPKAKTRVRCAWPWTGYRGMQRLYVKLALEDRVVWVNQRRPYEWGEKTPGTLDLVDMVDVEAQVLALYRCQSLEELSDVRVNSWSQR